MVSLRFMPECGSSKPSNDWFGLKVGEDAKLLQNVAIPTQLLLNICLWEFPWLPKIYCWSSQCPALRRMGAVPPLQIWYPKG